MKQLLILLIISLNFAAEIVFEDEINFPITYIELEKTAPKDTLWYTFKESGIVYIAYKKEDRNLTGFITRYYAGIWNIINSNKGNILRFIYRRVHPTFDERTSLVCDMENYAIIVESFDTSYVAYDNWKTKYIEGFQCDIKRKSLIVKDGDPSVLLMKWNGKHLIDKTNHLYEKTIYEKRR